MTSREGAATAWRDAAWRSADARGGSQSRIEDEGGKRSRRPPSSKHDLIGRRTERARQGCRSSACRMWLWVVQQCHEKLGLCTVRREERSPLSPRSHPLSELSPTMVLPPVVAKGEPPLHVRASTCHNPFFEAVPCMMHGLDFIYVPP